MIKFKSQDQRFIAILKFFKKTYKKRVNLFFFCLLSSFSFYDIRFTCLFLQFILLFFFFICETRRLKDRQLDFLLGVTSRICIFRLLYKWKVQKKKKKKSSFIIYNIFLFLFYSSYLYCISFVCRTRYFYYILYLLQRSGEIEIKDLCTNYLYIVWLFFYIYIILFTQMFNQKIFVNEIDCK